MMIENGKVFYLFIGGLSLVVLIIVALIGIKSNDQEKKSWIKIVLFKLRSLFMKTVMRFYYFSYLPLTISLFINLYLVNYFINGLALIKQCFTSFKLLIFYFDAFT